MKMREIKFRAWDNVKDRMYYVGEEDDISFGFESNGIVAYDLKEDEEEFKQLHHLKYMQYTGVEDARGYEIYEGDILKVTTVRGDTRWQMEVDFEKGCFSLKEGPELWKLKYDYPNHEVIGNIYENPELLEESK